MIHIIIGDNSTGKTLMLKNEMVKHKKTDITTNIREYRGIIPLVIDKSKFDALYYWSDIELGLNGDHIVALEDICFPVEVSDLVSLLLSDKPYLFLDEPFRQIPAGWDGYFMDAFRRLARTFKDVWVTTNNELMTLCGDNDTVYYLLTKCGITKVNSDEALELLDTI